MSSNTKAQKRPHQIRADAVRLARQYAEEREETGDPEGAEVIRDLARAISKISLDCDDSQPLQKSGK